MNQDKPDPIEGHLPLDPPPGMPVWDVDPYDAAILADPYDHYAQLRALGLVVYNPRWQVLMVGQHATTKQVFGDPDRFVSSRGVGLNDFRHGTPWRAPSIILEVDPPEHTRTRKVMARVLSPQVFAGLKDDFAAEAARLVAQVAARGRIEAVTDLGRGVPDPRLSARGRHDGHQRPLNRR